MAQTLLDQKQAVRASASKRTSCTRLQPALAFEHAPVFPAVAPACTGSSRAVFV